MISGLRRNLSRCKEKHAEKKETGFILRLYAICPASEEKGIEGTKRF